MGMSMAIQNVRVMAIENFRVFGLAYVGSGATEAGQTEDPCGSHDTVSPAANSAANSLWRLAGMG